MPTIRKATKADCPVIKGLAEQIFPATYSEILSPAQIDYMMEWMYSIPNLEKQMAGGHTFLLACLDGEPVGYVSVEGEGNDLFHLQKIYVLPGNQGAGLGKFLFDAVVGYIKGMHPGECTLELNVNRENPALKFYERMGMHIARSGDFDIGHGYYMNDHIMSKQI